MLCHVIQLRREGLRLRQSDWPEPVHGRLEMRCINAADNNFRRTMREAIISTRIGANERWVRQLFLFDPVLLHTVDDGLLLRGIQLKATDQGTFEHEQMWLCLFRWTGKPPDDIAKRLPETR